MPNSIGNAEADVPVVADSGPGVDVVRGSIEGERPFDAGGFPESFYRLNGSRCIVSTVHLAHSDLVLAGAIRETGSVRVRPNYQTVSNGSRLLIFEVETEEQAAFDRALERDPTVTDTMIVDYPGDDIVYRARLTDQALPVTPLLAQLGVTIRKTVGTGLGWTITAQFPSKGAYSTFRRYCESNGIGFHVNSLSWGSDRRKPASQTLTPSQWETLHTAYDRGYFDVPRRISQAELAEDLQISASAVSQRIRRIISQLLEETLDARNG